MGYIKYVMAKLSKYVKNIMQTFLSTLLKSIFLKMKNDLELVFISTSFAEFFDKVFSFAISRKLVKFHYQTVFTSQMIF